jgi:glycosyltransferase 2 family protein
LTARLLRIFVATALTLYMLYRADPAAVLRAASGADLTFIGLAILLVVADRALMAYRWTALLCIVDETRRPPTSRLLEIFFVSTFVGTFLPASIGGDAVRAYSLSRHGVGGADAVASVFMDRMLGVASLLVIGAVGVWLARDLSSNVAVLGALGLTAAVSAVTVAMVFSERVGLWTARVIRLAPLPPLQRLADAVVAAVREYRRFHGQLGIVLAASVAVQILRVLQAYLLGRAVGITVGVAVYFAFVPIILLVMLLPITINGLGTSQAAFVWFFARAGVAAPPAFALSVLFVGLGIVGNLPGGLIYAARGGLSPESGSALH